MNARRAARRVRGVGRAALAVAVLTTLVATGARAGERVSLDDRAMASLRAGAAYADVDLSALALGAAGNARSDARTKVFARGAVRRSAGGGNAYASGGDRVTSSGAGTARLGGIAASVEGGARASGPGAFTETQMDTRVVDTPSYSLAIGRLRSTACCDADSVTYASGATTLDGGSGYSHFAGRNSEGPVLTRSEIYVISTRYRLPQGSGR